MSVRILSKELQEKSCRELKEIPEEIQGQIERLRKWLAEQKHLTARQDDQTLLNFLRRTKFSFEKATARIDLFYTVRTLAPELFKDRNPFSAEMQKILQEGIVTLVMDSSESSSPVFIVIRWGLAHVKNVSTLNIVILFFMMLDLAMHENDYVTINGLYTLENYADFSPSQLSEWTPTIMRQFFTTFLGAYPTRVKGYHFFNVASSFEMLKFIASHVKEKAMPKMHAYTDMNIESLSKEISPWIIPDDFGGKADSAAQIRECKEKLESYADWFENDDVYGTNETKRSGNPKTAVEVFGLQENIKNLEIA